MIDTYNVHTDLNDRSEGRDYLSDWLKLITIPLTRMWSSLTVTLEEVARPPIDMSEKCPLHVTATPPIGTSEDWKS